MPGSDHNVSQLPKALPLVHPEVWTTTLAGCRQLFDYGTEVFSGKGKMWYST